MPKNLSDDSLSNEQPLYFASQPPLLSEDLIAQLQAAVKKARQIRTAQSSPYEHPDRRSPKL
jgi:hypothetical protein